MRDSQNSMNLAEQNLNSEKDVDQIKPKSNFHGEAIAIILLVLILLLAAYLRFTGLDWDQGTHIHPDERFLTMVGTRLEPASDPLNYLKTSESPLNPYNVKNGENKAFPLYVYGNFPMTVTRLTAVSANTLCDLFPNTQFTLCKHDFLAYDGIHLYGRFLSGLVDLIGVAFLFLIGRRLYGLKVALLGTFLLATAVMPIQQSHFFTMDNWAAALTTMTLYAAVRAATLGDETPRWQPAWYALFGLGLGLAVASRINVAPLALIITLSAIIYLTRADSQFSIPNFQFSISNHWQRAVLGILLAAIVSIITFRLAQPYAFADAALRQEQIAQSDPDAGFLTRAVSSVVGFNQDWLNNMAEIQRLQAPEASFPPANQWVARTPILFPFTNMVLYGMGLAAGLMAFVGLGWALWRIARFRPDWTAHAIPAVWSAMYFLFMGTRWVKSIRYFLPIYPTLLLLTAWALFALWERAKRTEGQRILAKTAVSLLILLTPLSSLLWANSFVKIYQTPVTRLAASDWMFENVPSGATLLYNVNGAEQELHLPLKSFDFVPGGIPLTLNFNVPEAGTITGVRFNYLSDPDYVETGADSGEILRLRFNDEEVGEMSLNLDGERQSAFITLPETAVTPDQPLQLITELTGDAPVRAGTSILANEHWDDPLPIGTNGRNAFGAYYSGDTQPVTHPDNSEKRQQVIGWLDEADYVILSSQRALWSLPRLPLKYPLMMRYYEALFSGELGFKLIHQEQANLHIGSLYISETSAQLGWGQPPIEGWPPPGALAAEEAFSVYDHPPVWIFVKTDSYSHDNTLQILGSVNLDQSVDSNPLTATQAPNGLLLPKNVQAVQQANGTFSEIFNIDGVLSQNPTLAAIVWWATAVILGWLTFPITFIALRGLPDKGYALSRILSLLLVSYFAWLTGSLNLLPYTRSTLLAGVGVVAVVNLLLFLRYRREMWGFLRGNGRYILTVELIGITLYLLQIGIRLGNPDVWDIIWGGEKPMDLSYFTAVLKSTTFPPYDPWFAGGYINYYYYGFVYVGTLTKLLAIPPTLAYNLILPMLYSFTGLGVFSIAYNLVIFRDWRLEIGDSGGTRNLQSPIPNRRLHNPKALKAGLLAITLAIILGNLGEIGVIINAWMKAGSEQLGNLPLIGGLVQFLDGGLKILSGQPAPIYPGDWFWTATRAINANPGEVQTHHRISLLHLPLRRPPRSHDQYALANVSIGLGGFLGIRD